MKLNETTSLFDRRNPQMNHRPHKRFHETGYTRIADELNQ